LGGYGQQARDGGYGEGTIHDAGTQGRRRERILGLLDRLVEQAIEVRASPLEQLQLGNLGKVLSDLQKDRRPTDLLRPERERLRCQSHLAIGLSRPFDGSALLHLSLAAEGPNTVLVDGLEEFDEGVGLWARAIPIADSVHRLDLKRMDTKRFIADLRQQVTISFPRIGTSKAR
jgi:hypothetical protein